MNEEAEIRENMRLRRLLERGMKEMDDAIIKATITHAKEAITQAQKAIRIANEAIAEADKAMRDEG
ncbi:hypothetical protein [Heyndrickxia faecalis]|uniref:hypothetical protein n=1 Tax=Heyndrickxia faecalis TaxID=2824910 RepID=UPI0032B1A9C1